MRCLIRALLALLVAAAAGRQAHAGEADAAELPALIDQHIESRLSSEGLGPAALGGDAEFLRRVYLDLHGVIPRRDQIESFLVDSYPAKRARLVEALLA